jgi:hypothetical protein
VLIIRLEHSLSFSIVELRIFIVGFAQSAGHSEAAEWFVGQIQATAASKSQSTFRNRPSQNKVSLLSNDLLVELT